ncbi:MAG: recombinase family protein, partial [Dehalococcoidia bacterium]|nr:recombinase family protein [Dehalococcoidia bacterium]
MTILTLSRIGHRPLTFEDLRGLRAEGYIRDSTLDQRDGFGPDIQRHSIERFAQSYGLILGGRWYTEFISGRQVKKRLEFQQFLEDARVDS